MTISPDDVLERLARSPAAVAADRRHPAIAAMMSGAGRHLVLDQNVARMILAERLVRARRRSANGLGSRPEPAPLPITSTPAAVTAGARPRKPETSRD